ncbi:MAG TPA: leucine-rich repeat domain-containing protein [Verrucomicrobiae bacterium]|nr:leucine-rich repeat domain-containing protein [Verrucomicrobiae bacterium]
MNTNLRKTIVRVSLTILTTLAIVPLAWGQFTFTTNNGAITITGYNTAAGLNAVIPASINGYPVVSIGDGASAAFPSSSITNVVIPGSVTNIGATAFYNCQSLTRVTIPNSVTSIGGGAFYNCYSLTNVTIGNSVTSIGNSVFYYCISLSSVTIPNSVTSIEESAFGDCFGLTSVTIPNSVTNIGNYAFQACTNLTDVTIPNSVTNIGSGAFVYCLSLTNVTIPNSVITIGSEAFNQCCNLTSVTIPSSVTSIGDLAFYSCTSLTNIAVNVSNPNYSSFNGVLFDKAQTTLIMFPPGLGGSYTIPNSVTSIRQSAFQSCFGLTSVTIPNSVTSIEGSVFSGCTSLTNVTIPNSVTNIGFGAFSSCYSLTSVTIPNSVISIGGGAFGDCSGLTNVTIPNSVTSIDGGAFSGCTSLTNVTIPNSVTNIGFGAFSSCYSLTIVTIPNSVTIILDVFEFCTSLTNIAVDVSNPNYSSFNGILFNKAQTTLFIFPPGLGGSYNTPNSVTNIRNHAFYHCANLTAVYFQGNAPAPNNDSSVFLSDPATIFYLPGTSGWGAGFDGRPTALWYLPTPLILTGANGNNNFGVRSNRFGFTISWATNLSVVVEACTNLANPLWTPLATNALVSGTNYFSDSTPPTLPRRFYRARPQ